MQPPTSTFEETVFDVRRLSKTYLMGDVTVSALGDVTLTIPARELVVLLPVRLR